MNPLLLILPFALSVATTFGMRSQPTAPGAPEPLLTGFEAEAICVLPVRDVAASKAWYAKVFGSQEAMALQDGSWAELTTPRKELLFGLSREAAPDVRGGRKLVFAIADVEKARAALLAAKVPCGEIQTIPGVVKLLEFQDPDGNPFVLARSLAAPAPPASRPAQERRER